MKRFLSIILAAVMIISLLPAAFAADGEVEPTVYKYEFTLAGAGETGNQNIEDNDNISYNETVKGLRVPNKTAAITSIGNDNNDDGLNWRYVDAMALYENEAAKNNCSQFTELGFWSRYQSGSISSSNGVVFEVYIPENGEYIPKINYLPQKYAVNGTVKAYIVHESINGTTDVKYYDFRSTADTQTVYNSVAYLVQSINGSFNSPKLLVPLIEKTVSTSKNSASTVTDIQTVSGDAVTLQSGLNYLLLSYDCDSIYFPYINSFELEKIPSLEIAASATTVEIGNKVTIDTTTDASAITYKSSDDGIATVVYDAATGIATVTGVSKGTATITASVDGYDVSKSVEIEITGRITKYEFTLDAMNTTGTHSNTVTNTTNSHAEKGMSGGNWTYVGGHAYTAGKDNYYSQFTPYGFWYYSASSGGGLGTNGIVFEINVPDDGEYTTTLNYLPSYAGGTVYACVIDKAINGRLHTNDYPYDFCDTISDTVTISDSANYAENALKASLRDGIDLRSEITLALSGELQYTNTAKVTDSTIAEIKAKDTVALKAGKYYLMIASDGIKTEHTSSSKYMPYINSFEIEKVGELDEALDAAFAVNKQDDYKYTAPTVNSFTSNGVSITAEKNDKGYYNITAPEENSAGEKFLYWAKGLNANKRIVSWTRAITDYVPDDSGTNYLIAVYDSEGPTEEKAEYYNANGQLIATGTKPSELSMAGYGDVTGWNRYGEKHIYVAEYGNKTQPDDVTVTVNGEDKTVPYGNPITCTATAENGSGAPFKCWTKTDIDGKTEVVSIDKEYTFKAWEKCTVTAVYEEHSFVSVVMKIITDSFDAGSETGIMAEFIGFDNKVVEKGIMFGDNRIAMTAPGNQFSVIADENGKYKGYAIVKNTDETYSLVTGNEITVSNAK